MFKNVVKSSTYLISKMPIKISKFYGKRYHNKFIKNLDLSEKLDIRCLTFSFL